MNTDLMYIFVIIIFQTRLRASSQSLQRWLATWIMFIMVWSIMYLVFWIKNKATLYGIAEFLIPLLLLPLMCSAYGEVNNEGRRMLKVRRHLLTLPMLRLLSSKAQERKDSWKSSKPCHVGIHWKALAEFSQMSTHLPGFRSFSRFFASLCIGQISHQQHKG